MSCLKDGLYRVITPHKAKITKEYKTKRKRRFVKSGLGMIADGLSEIGGAILDGMSLAAAKVVLKVRNRKLSKYTAYIEKYGYEVGINSKIKFNGKAYYVMGYEIAQSFDTKREVRLNLIGAPQYREIKRRMKDIDNQRVSESGYEDGKRCNSRY